MLCISLLLTSALTVGAQQVLTLDSCRALALRNNKQVNVARLSKDLAYYNRKSARTQYLPKVDVLGGYQYTSREINLLSKTQKNTLSNLGTTSTSAIGQSMTSGLTDMITGMVQQGQLTAEQAQQMSGLLQQFSNGPLSQSFATLGNNIGKQVVDALHTDTHNLFAGTVMLRQPIYMGGAIVAANKIADISETMADNNLNLKNQGTLYNIDQAYWTVVSLRQKQKLAYSYRDLVKKLDDDVAKMIKQGVATRSDGLKVAVRVNEADMQITQVDDGLVLSKMLLCQLCGLPMSEQIVLVDEEREDLDAVELAPQLEVEQALENRPELRQLQNLVDLSKQQTNVLKAGNLPQVALTGGYMVSNPNLYNGFQRKFSGVWNVGVLVRIPVWNWGDVAYKVRASKGATTMARLQMDEARELITLQVNQSNFQVREANRKLEMSKANIRKADENLRTANLGFSEGVISSTTVMEAQTAWLQAQSQKIDAEIDVKLSQVNLQKALGTLSN